jgi:type I restriction enzyme M protein
VLAGIDYNDEQKLGDTKNRDNVLSRLVQHFSGVNLRNSNLSEPDMLGRAYEYLIVEAIMHSRGFSASLSAIDVPR